MVKIECSNCSEEAVIEIKRKGKNYCPDHYRKYFLNQVGKVLDKYEIEGKIAVAISGGKDSSTCAEALTHFERIDVRSFYINLGIGEYSKKSRGSAKEVSDELGLDLDIIDLERRYGRSVPEINEEEGGSPCALCGMIKRYLTNRYAFENGFDYVATGHNLSDEVSSTFHNLANVYLTPFRGLEPVLNEKKNYKLAERVKPLYFLKDKETLIYAQTNDISFYHGECPLSQDSPTDELKNWLHELDSEKPGIMRSFAKSFMRLEDRMEKDQRELKKCENCGYATATRICRFCRVVRNFP
ncbi:hypothetical protein AKJ57_03055 [candidate division MSBL1 archaeon SCGC-AAA259A05]|uniref:2-thiouridine synthetase TtuA-like N-terminal LIM domain-containing protein n=1 Tax=candidate division MSBL1 archaeon SCGC-AAA259A05 TaxID=1698259 RepID=A0A133U9W7_9EURY|nr:hypothetical protein AKJ57_03055 [candidate division MSBL1 archaeon SCGC-AAA259A05]